MLRAVLLLLSERYPEESCAFRQVQIEIVDGRRSGRIEARAVPREILRLIAGIVGASNVQSSILAVKRVFGEC